MGLRELASLDDVAGLVGRALEHAENRELSRSEPSGEIDSLVAQLCEVDRRPHGFHGYGSSFFCAAMLGLAALAPPCASPSPRSRVASSAETATSVITIGG